MPKDFYLNERSHAAYVEKDWGDLTTNFKFTFAPFVTSKFFDRYHEQLVSFLSEEARKVQPRTMLEIGSSLGRTFYEVAGKVPSIKIAKLVEPSKVLYDSFNRIFRGGSVEKFQVLLGNNDLQEVDMDTSLIREICAHVNFQAINSTFQKLPNQGQFDLVICSNVIDQCHEPMKLIQLLKDSVAPQGLLVLSCTYQWQDKYIGNASEQIKNINDLFDSESWTHLRETNIPFRLRAYERYWMEFLSHASVFLKR